MSKNFVAGLILLLLSGAGIVLAYFTRYDFIGGVITGVYLLLFFLSWIGRRQAEKAVDQVEKRIRDYRSGL